MVLIVSPSRFYESPIAKFQTVNDPERPLIKLKPVEREEVFVALAATIESTSRASGTRRHSSNTSAVPPLSESSQSTNIGDRGTESERIPELEGPAALMPDDRNFLESLIRNVAAWNAWRADKTSENVDLSFAKLSALSLRGAQLSSTDLRYSDLRNTNLSDADLRNADLHDADVTSAVLRNANLSYADLTNADFRGADLTGANLLGATLVGTNLSKATCARTSPDTSVIG